MSDTSKVYSVSYDGTIRYLDLEKEAFVQGFCAPEVNTIQNIVNLLIFITFIQVFIGFCLLSFIGYLHSLLFMHFSFFPLMAVSIEVLSNRRWFVTFIIIYLSEYNHHYYGIYNV